MKNIKKKLSILMSVLSLTSLVGCNYQTLSVRQIWIDRSTLASTHVGTPDPRQENPPEGQLLLIDWKIPNWILEHHPRISLQLIFWNYTTETVDFPLMSTFGSKRYYLLNDKYEETKGLLTYKADIITEDGQIYKEWKHQMWVNLIQIGNEDIPHIPHEIPPLLNPQENEEQMDKEEEEYLEIEPSIELADSISSTVVDQSIQGSVMDTAYFNEERFADKY